MVFNFYNDRKAYHLTSPDGITNWKNIGLAYDPTSSFVRYTNGTINHWYKMERPGIVMENGYVTHFTFAVVDVDKSLDLTNDSHGSKVIVVPFDGVRFDGGATVCAFSLGDANGNGTIDIIDALIIAQYYIGLAPSSLQTCAADVTKDGKIDIVDALRIAQYCVGLITSL